MHTLYNNYIGYMLHNYEIYEHHKYNSILKMEINNFIVTNTR